LSRRIQGYKSKVLIVTAYFLVWRESVELKKTLRGTAETLSAQHHHGRIPSGAHRVAKRRTLAPSTRALRRLLTLQLLQLNLTKVEQCGQGAALVQVFDSIYRTSPADGDAIN
jgi:hypothetical protein